MKIKAVSYDALALDTVVLFRAPKLLGVARGYGCDW